MNAMDWTYIHTAVIVGLAGFGLRELFRVAQLLKAMEQRFIDNERRLSALESKEH